MKAKFSARGAMLAGMKVPTAIGVGAWSCGIKPLGGNRPEDPELGETGVHIYGEVEDVEEVRV